MTKTLNSESTPCVSPKVQVSLRGGFAPRSESCPGTGPVGEDFSFEILVEHIAVREQRGATFTRVENWGKRNKFCKGNTRCLHIPSSQKSEVNLVSQMSNFTGTVEETKQVLRDRKEK